MSYSKPTWRRWKELWHNCRMNWGKRRLIMRRNFFWFDSSRPRTSGAWFFVSIAFIRFDLVCFSGGSWCISVQIKVWRLQKWVDHLVTVVCAVPGHMWTAMWPWSNYRSSWLTDPTLWQRWRHDSYSYRRWDKVKCLALCQLQPFQIKNII